MRAQVGISAQSAESLAPAITQVCVQREVTIYSLPLGGILWSNRSRYLSYRYLSHRCCP